jgi:hypothetical protein
MNHEKSAEVIVVLRMKGRTILNLGKQGGVDIPINCSQHRGKDQKMATYGWISWKLKSK